MTREQWNIAYGLCWMATIAVAYFISGPAAALIAFFLPALLIGTLIGVLGELWIDWENHLRPRRREERPDQRPDSE
jgi:hypothetical protein